ncbi:MAG: phage repressor protein C with HTH and peptisase S24 domain [Lysobacterales bacterium]|jgi:phage repressor protein C with HTH and peptisase S24 domain
MHINTNQKIHHFLKEAAADDLQLSLRGDCMTPSLHNGSNIKVRSAGFYWPGDVLVYRDQNDHLLAHRLLGYYRRQGNWRYLTQADNARRPDMGVAAFQVIGKVLSAPVSLRHRISAAWRFTRHVARYLHQLKRI